MQIKQMIKAVENSNTLYLGFFEFEVLKIKRKSVSYKVYNIKPNEGRFSVQQRKIYFLILSFLSEKSLYTVVFLCYNTYALCPLLGIRGTPHGGFHRPYAGFSGKYL